MKKVITNHQVIRNYVITVGSVVIMSIFMADLFHSHDRTAQQEKLNGYAPFIGAGFVNYGKDFIEP